MATFPALIPSTRIFTPGIYPHTVFAGMSGRSNRVRNSNAMLESQLRLSFLAITEAQMLSILAHYSGQQSGFLSFPLPSDVWSGGNPSDLQLSGYGWIYREPPTVEDLACGGHNVELVLETVPPEGTALLGLNLTVRMLLSAGTVASASGAALSMAYSLAGGQINQFGMNGTIGYSLTPGSAAITDPSFSSVSLLLHMDGSNGSTTFTDSSANGLVVSPVGAAQISTAQSKFGGASAYLASTGCLSVATSAALDLPGDFTIEMFTHFVSVTATGLIARPNGSSISPVILDVTGGQLRLRASSNGTSYGLDTSSLGALTTGAFQHVALTRDGSTWRVFINGVQTGTVTNSITPFTSTNSLIIGSRNASGGFMNGYIDEVRITKGIARYTSNFTPPASAFPDS